MKFAPLLILIPLVFLNSCGSVSPAAADVPGIVVEANQVRECGQGRLQFPAGLYKAEVVSPRGTYYLAPEPLRTEGVLLGRSEKGGLFLPNSSGAPQAAWFGDPSDEVDEHPGTLFGAIGVSAPRLWKFTPPVAYRVKK